MLYNLTLGYMCMDSYLNNHGILIPMNYPYAFKISFKQGKLPHTSVF